MNKFFFTAASVCLTATLSFAAKLPSSHIRGQYVEARSADVYTGPCFANSEIGLAGDLAVMGWRIEKGSYDGVTLDGLSVMGVVKAKGTLGDFAEPNMPAKAVIIIDEAANAEQRLALKQFAQTMGAGLLSDVVSVEFRPITFDMDTTNAHATKAVMAAGDLARLETRPLSEKDQICHNESVWYGPLTKLDHAMPAYTVTNGYDGKGLGTTWNYSGNRGSFVGTFQLEQ